MGFIFVCIIWGYIILAAITIWLTRKLTKSKKATLIVAALFILYPFRRLILFEALIFPYYRQTPLQEIHQTVESPISVYWQDNVWPGFDDYGRHWMIDNYLDGVHLKVLALNGEDGKIYLYKATGEDFKKNKKAKKLVKLRENEHETFRQKDLAVYKKTGKHMEKAGEIMNTQLDPPIYAARREYKRLKEVEIKLITDRAEIYNSASDLPPINYRVEFNLMPQGEITQKLLHADRISIFDTRKNKEIAFSRRYLAYSAWIAKVSGEQPKFDYKLGDISTYEFDDKVLLEYAGVMDGLEITKDNLNKKFYYRTQ